MLVKNKEDFMGQILLILKGESDEKEKKQYLYLNVTIFYNSNFIQLRYWDI